MLRAILTSLGDDTAPNGAVSSPKHVTELLFFHLVFFFMFFKTIVYYVLLFFICLLFFLYFLLFFFFLAVERLSAGLRLRGFAKAIDLATLMYYNKRMSSRWRAHSARVEAILLRAFKGL